MTHDAVAAMAAAPEAPNPLVRRFAVNRLLAPMRAVFEPAEAVFGKASPPVADDPRLNTHFLGNRSVLRPSAASTSSAPASRRAAARSAHGSAPQAFANLSA